MLSMSKWMSIVELELSQVDVKTILLHGELDEHIHKTKPWHPIERLPPSDMNQNGPHPFNCIII